MNKQLSNAVAKFKKDVCNAPLPTRCKKSMTTAWKDSTYSVLKDEIDELHTALAADDLVEVADALGDIIYFATGQALLQGIDIDNVLAEIHRSNMTKKPGVKEGPTTPNDVIKDKDYVPPNIKKVLRRAP